MVLNKLNYLLQQTHERNYENFNELYNYSQGIIRSFANKMYGSVIKKDLYSIEDLVQEVWVNLLGDIVSHEVELSEEYGFCSYVSDIVNVTLAKIND